MLHQAPLERGGESRHVHFAYVSTAPGKQWHAWVAGPTHWYVCHTPGKTKPCLREISGGKLACPLCDPARPPEVIGYQPLYREIDSKPVMVIVHEYAREQCDQLKTHQRVLCGRGDDQADGMYVIPALKATPVFASTLAARRCPADLTETLIRVWKIPELTAWHEKNRAAAPAARRVAVKDNGKPFDPQYQAAALRAGADTSDAPEVVNDYNALLAKAKEQAAAKPSKNGKH